MGRATGVKLEWRNGRHANYLNEIKPGIAPRSSRRSG